MNQQGESYLVVETRSGRVLSRHTSEQLAFAALERYDRQEAKRLNKPTLMGGGYGQIERAVMKEIV